MPRSRARRAWWFAALLFLPAVREAQAFHASSDETPEVQRTDPASVRNSSNQWKLTRDDPRLDDFRDTYGEGWRVRWNELARTPHRAFGGRIAASAVVPATGAPRDAATVAALAEAFVRGHTALLGLHWEDLRPQRLEFRGGRWVVILQQWTQGIEMVGGRVDLRFTPAGDLVLFGSDAYPVPAAWTGSLGADACIQAALQGMPSGTLPHTGAPEAVFLPMLADEPLPPGVRKTAPAANLGPEALRVRPAYRLHLKTLDPPGDWETYVDAETGSVLWRFDRVHTLTGHLSGDVHPLQGTAPLASLAFGAAEIFCGAVRDTVAAYGFESGAAGWSAQTPWALSGESVHGGTQAWSDSPGANYADYRNVSLTSPKLDIRGVHDPVLSFWTRVEVEDTWDFLYVEGSADNGSTWRTLMALSGTAAWHEERIDLSAFTDTRDLRLRFRLFSDGAVNAAGCWVDDVVVARLGSTVTAPDGSFAVVGTGGDSTLVTRMRGPYAQVFNRGAGGVQATLTAPPTGALTLHWGSGNSRADERDTFHALNAGRARLASIDPAFVELDQPLPVFVGTSFCNAYYGGWQIVVGAGGTGCADLGLWESVVVHEYGHAITDHVYGVAGDPPSDMHEAFSDYFAASLSGEPRIGPGILGTGTVFRSIDNELRAPEDVSGEAHIDGTILAGALWDLRSRLWPQVDLADSLFHFARYGAPKNFEDYYLDLLGVDDDDGNLGNGTPHLESIRSAFGDHGIGTGPEFETVQLAVQDAGGNGDGRLDGGETAQLRLTLRNYGGSETGVYVKIATAVPGVAIGVDSVPCGSVGAGAEIVAPSLFQVSIDPGVAAGTAVVLEIEIHSSQGVNGGTFMLPVGYVPILFVDDDRGMNFETWFTTSLARLGQKCLRWDAGTLGSPSAEQMARYRAVVWSTGNDRRNTLTPADQEELAAYLGAGGRLFLTGEDIGEDLWKGSGGVATPADKAFYENWLRAKVNIESEGAPAVQGLAGDPLSAGLALTLNGGTGANNLNSCSSLLPVNGSVECMRYSNGHTAALRYDGVYRLVYAGFGFEGLNSVSQRDTLMARTLRWLSPPEATPPSVALVQPNGGEHLLGASSTPIRWTATDAVAVTAVNLRLSTDGGQSFTTIAAGLPNSFTYSWNIPDLNSSSCLLRIEALDPSGNVGSDVSDAPFAITRPTDVAVAVPLRFALHGAMPNPFNPVTTLCFDLPRAARVRLEILAPNGRRVRTLVAGEFLQPGRLQRLWDGLDDHGRSVASGVFLVHLQADGFTAARKIQLLR